MSHARRGGMQTKKSSRTKLNPRPASRSPKLKAPLTVSLVEKERAHYRAEMRQYFDLMQSKFELELYKRAIKNNPLETLMVNEKLDAIKEKMGAASKRITKYSKGIDKVVKKQVGTALYEIFVKRLLTTVNASKKMTSKKAQERASISINAIIQVMQSDLVKSAFKRAAAEKDNLYESTYEKIHPKRSPQTGRYVSHAHIVKHPNPLYKT
jgi:hypothetical protein